MKRSCLSILLGGLLGMGAFAQDVPAPAPAATARVTVTADTTGLPAQIAIAADMAELPLDARSPDAAKDEALLRTLGRGAQLRSPIRIEVTTGGKTVPATGKVTGQGNVTDGTAVMATLTADAFKAELGIQTGSMGELAVTATISSTAPVDRAELVIEPIGLVDTIIPGMPVDPAAKGYDRAAFALGLYEGVVWQNTKAENLPKARVMPGVVPHCYLGSGDRGFTWLTDPKQGWNVDPASPTMTVTRDKAGNVTWRIALVNRTETIAQPRRLEFMLLTHPATFRAKDALRQAWIAWPASASKPEAASFTTEAVRNPGTLACLPADAATLHERKSAYRLLVGAAGGNAPSALLPLGVSYPLPLGAYLAGTMTGQTARIRSNAPSLVKPGASPALDRSALGRALLLRAGLDAATLADPARALPVVKALHEFGVFADDGLTEFLPPWRSGTALRFGEVFSETDVFALTTENPVASVSVACYIRPVNPQNPAIRKALMIIANESPTSVRDQLYILDSKRLFGRENRLNSSLIGSHPAFAGMDADSDWAKGKVTSGRPGDRALLDVEDGGIVQWNRNPEGQDTYGPQIFVPAHGFRMLLGSGQ